MRRLPLLSMALACVGLLGLDGCTCGGIHSNELLQRMESQQKYLPYRENPLFADDRAMRVPPKGTVPRERPVGGSAITRGLSNGQLVQEVPLPLTPTLLARGKKRFDIVCATCHGVLGDGDSTVAQKMPTRRPPSLVALQDKPAGFFYQAITLGFGLMPSFSGEIPVEDRWAVVAYVRALQLSQGARFAALPKVDQQKVAEAKP